jgi:pilus assembly protein Flp/PilA
MKEIMKRFFKEEEGQGLVEYALIITLIALAVVVALTAFGGGISNSFINIKAKLGLYS